MTVRSRRKKWPLSERPLVGGFCFLATAEIEQRIAQAVEDDSFTWMELALGLAESR